MLGRGGEPRLGRCVSHRAPGWCREPVTAPNPRGRTRPRRHPIRRAASRRASRPRCSGRPRPTRRWRSGSQGCSPMRTGTPKEWRPVAAGSQYRRTVREAALLRPPPGRSRPGPRQGERHKEAEPPARPPTFEAPACGAPAIPGATGPAQGGCNRGQVGLHPALSARCAQRCSASREVLQTEGGATAGLPCPMPWPSAGSGPWSGSLAADVPRPWVGPGVPAVQGQRTGAVRRWSRVRVGGEPRGGRPAHEVAPHGRPG